MIAEPALSGTGHWRSKTWHLGASNSSNYLLISDLQGCWLFLSPTTLSPKHLKKNLVMTVCDT